MEAVGAVVTITGLIGGVVKITSTINDLKARWEYAGLSITVLSSSLWAVKAALEELVDWRSKSKDKSEKSEQLDKNLEVCIQGCAVLVAFMENRLQEFDLENLSKLDKAKIMSLDTLFKTFATDLGAQVRALQLLLTIYQCRSLTEQHEWLQRKDTRRVVRAARQSTASLRYEDKDIEDAASILSETPSKSFEFDSIIMQHQSYSRTYPRLYHRMQQNFPSRRGSFASTIRENATRLRPIPIEDPIAINTPDLPFLGLPFVGETAPIVESELEDQEEWSHETMAAEFPDTALIEFPGASTILQLASKETNAIGHASIPINGGESSVDINPGSLSKVLPTDKPIWAEETGTLDSSSSERIPIATAIDELDHGSDSENSHVSPVRPPRTSTYDSLYDDSDDELVPHWSESSPQTDPALIGHEHAEDASVEGASQKVQPSASLRSGSTSTDPHTLPKPTVDEELSHPVPDTTSPRLIASEAQANSGYGTPQETLSPSLDGRLPDTADHEASSGSETESPPTDKIGNHETGMKDVSVPPSNLDTGDRQQGKFLSGLLYFPFDHNIDLSLTPRVPLFEKLESKESQKASQKEEDSETEVIADFGVTQPDTRLVLDSPTKEPVATKDQTNRNSGTPIVEGSSTPQSLEDQPDLDSAAETILPTLQTVGGEKTPFNNLTSLPGEDPNNRESLLNYHTLQNDPFRRPHPEQRKGETTQLTTPNRPPPPVPSLPIPLISNEIFVVGEGLLPKESSFDDGPGPPQNKIILNSDKILFQDGRSSFQSERSTNMQTPASPTSLHSHHGTSSVTSVESSYISRDTASTYTQGTTVTATLPNSARIISDPSQHDKTRVGITKAFSQYGQITPQPMRHRLSNLASMLNPRTASERNAKALELAFTVRAGNTSRVLSIVQSFDKPNDISTPASIENDTYPITALMRAAKLRDVDCMDVLLKYDPQGIACVDNLGQTALHHALMASAFSAVLWLIDRSSGADEVQSKGRNTYRMIDMRDKNGVAAVHHAARLNDVLVMEAMQKACADFGARDAKGGTVLEYAVAACSSHVVQYLIKQRLTDVNSRNGRGETALMAAVHVNDELTVKTLLENGAIKGIRDNNGDMAIHHAARCGTLPILELLFQSIEDVKAKNSIGEQPIHLAAAGNHVNILFALLQLPGVQVNAWTEPPHLRQSVKRAEGLAATAKLASTALHYACSAGHYEAADILLTRGAKANGNQEDGYSPLMMASQAKSAPIVSLLLLHGADPKGSTSTDGMTALHIAVRANDVPCTKMLLEHGANPLARTTKSQDTPTSLVLRQNSQSDAANVCMRYAQEVLKTTNRINGIPSPATAAAATATQPRHTPNVRPIIPGPTLSSNRTGYQPIGMPGPQIPYFTAAEEQPPPPPYQA